MITPELKSYIEASLAQGKTPEEIKSILRAQGGWTEQDLNEAFAVPMPAKASSILWKILVPVLIVGLGIGVYFVYKSDWYQNQKTNIYPSSLIPPEATTQSTSTETPPPVENATPANQVADTSSTSEKDCGVSATAGVFINAGNIASTDEFNALYKNDSAVQCMGQRIIKCESAKISFKSDTPGSYDNEFYLPEPTLQVFNKRGICYFKVTIKIKERLEKFNECPLSLVKKQGTTAESTVDLTVSDKKNPALYTVSATYYGMFGFLYDIAGQLEKEGVKWDNTNTDLIEQALKQRHTELGCSGDLLPHMLDSLRTARAKASQAR